MSRRHLAIPAAFEADVSVFYDGACPLCRREIAWMRRLDRHGRLDFVDVSDAFAACPIDRVELLARFHVRERGTLHSGAAAFAAMWRALPMMRPLGLLARHRIVLQALEALYLAFLRIRPQLQRWCARRFGI